MSVTRQEVRKEGQRYVDEPVYLAPKPVSEIEGSVASAFNRRLHRPLFLGFRRVLLNWVKPKMPSPEFYRDDAN